MSQIVSDVQEHVKCKGSLRCGHSSQLHTTLWARIDSTGRGEENSWKLRKQPFVWEKKSEIIWNNVKRRKSEKNMDFIQSAFDAMKAPLVLCRAPGYPPLLKELLQAQPFSAAPAGGHRDYQWLPIPGTSPALSEMQHRHGLKTSTKTSYINLNLKKHPKIIWTTHMVSCFGLISTWDTESLQDHQ